MHFSNGFFHPYVIKHISSLPFVCQNLLLLNPTERFLTEQSLNHPAFQPLRQVERERPAPPASPNPPRSSKRKTHHHGENTVPTRSDVFCFVAPLKCKEWLLLSGLRAWLRISYARRALGGMQTVFVRAAVHDFTLVVFVMLY